MVNWSPVSTETTRFSTARLVLVLVKENVSGKLLPAATAEEPSP